MGPRAGRTPWPVLGTGGPAAVGSGRSRGTQVSREVRIVDGAAGRAKRAQRMTPARIASATIWARSPVPSLRPILDRWLFTVSAERFSASPISLLD
jgi:hypothetical protein